MCVECVSLVVLCMKCAGGLTSKLIALIGGARHQLTNTQQIVRLHTGAIVKRVLLCLRAGVGTCIKQNRK